VIFTSVTPESNLKKKRELIKVSNSASAEQIYLIPF